MTHRPPPSPSAAQIRTQLRELVSSGTAAKTPALLRHGGYIFSFKALTAGRLVINWYYVPHGRRTTKAKAVLVATGKARIAAAGKVTITIKFTAKGKRILKTAKRLKLTARATFAQTGKSAVSTIRTFTVRR